MVASRCQRLPLTPARARDSIGMGAAASPLEKTSSPHGNVAAAPYAAAAAAGPLRTVPSPCAAPKREPLRSSAAGCAARIGRLVALH